MTTSGQEGNSGAGGDMSPTHRAGPKQAQQAQGYLHTTPDSLRGCCTDAPHCDTSTAAAAAAAVAATGGPNAAEPPAHLRLPVSTTASSTGSRRALLCEELHPTSSGCSTAARTVAAAGWNSPPPALLQPLLGCGELRTPEPAAYGQESSGRLRGAAAADAPGLLVRSA
eukprot:scaffold19915_cov17-Tisochrysis_lutea.AAC.4